MPAPFKRQLTADKDLQLIQDNVQNAFNPVQAIPMLGGNVVAPTGNVIAGPPNSSGVVINTTSTAIAHGLDHVPSYWIMLGLSGNANIWNSAAFDSKFIYLQASVQCAAILWVN